MSEKIEIYVHVGIHKTGSSFMQRQFFNSLEGIHYCDCRNEYHDFLDYLLHQDEFDFSQERASVLFQEAGELTSSVPVVLSDEMFYAPMQWSRYTNRRRGCERLAKLFPTAKVAIVLRNQLDLLQSFYMMYIKTGGTSSWSGFLKKNIADGYLHYASYIEALERLFGNGNVKIFLYEDFVESPENYLSGWCDWLGVSGSGWDKQIIQRDENPSISPGYLRILRYANKFLSSRRNPDQLLPKQLHSVCSKALLAMSKHKSTSARHSLCPANEILDGLLAGCRAGNKTLSDMLNRDLSKLNYPS